MFAYVKCSCGRMLRAQRSPERTTVRCWDCKAEVEVPRFRSVDGPRPIDRLRGAIASDWAETAAGIILLTLAVAAATALPSVGGWFSLALLVCAAVIYLRRIEHVGLAEETELDDPSSSSSIGWLGGIGRLALALALVVVFVVPLWLVDGSKSEVYTPPVMPPPWPPLAMMALWALLPLVAFSLVARDAQGRLGPALALATAWRHRWSTIAVLLLPIAVLIAAEAALLGLLFWSENLNTVVLDHFPLAEGMRIERYLVRKDGAVQFIPAETLRFYGSGLLRGATLLGSFPLAFLRGPEPRINLVPYGTFGSEVYLLFRLGITAFSMLALFGSLAIQSYLLGRIALASRRSEVDPGEVDTRAIARQSHAPAEAEVAAS